MRTDILSGIEIKLDRLLESVGDVALKRRARKLILDLDLKDGDCVTDLGCGDGFYLYLLSNLPIKLKLLGFDKDEIVLRNAKHNLHQKDIRLIEGNIIKMPFKTDTFAKVIMTEVLEHVEDDKKALSEVYRILQPGGILVLTVPSYNFPFLWDPVNWVLQNLFGTHIDGTNFFAGIWARHKRLYTRKHLQSLVSKSQFKIEQAEELTTRCLPFNHYLVNIVARLLYDSKLSSKMKDPFSKFKNVKKPFLVRPAFFLVNLYDKLNDLLPGKNGLNIYIKAIK